MTPSVTTRDRRRQRLTSDAGFTVAELLVVIVVLAVLLAISFPTFVGAREAAQNRGTQATLRSVLIAAQTRALEPSSAPVLTPAAIQPDVGNVQLVGYTATAARGQASVIAGQCFAYGTSCGGGGFWAAAASPTALGACWAAYIPSFSGSGVQAEWQWRVSRQGDCSSYAALASTQGWTSTWGRLRDVS